MEIWDNDSYTAPVDCLINQSIYEYDIKQANISILLESGIIDESKFNYYANLPKIDREISIGLLQRDNPEIAEALKGIPTPVEEPVKQEKVEAVKEAAVEATAKKEKKNK